MSTATAQPASLMTKLDLEWNDRYADVVRDFGLPEPLTGGQLREKIRNTAPAGRDEMLHAMLTAAHAGNRDAERVLVQLLIPVARRMAHRISTLSDYDWGDRVSVAIVTAWETIRRYQLRRNQRVWANLTMDLLGALNPRKTANDLQIADRTITVDHDILTAVVEATPAAEPSPEVRLASLFTWAVDVGVLTRDEVALLSRVALGDETQDVIAAELGTTAPALRMSVIRIRKRLSAAVRDQL